MHYYVQKCVQINQVKSYASAKNEMYLCIAQINVRLLSYKRVLMTSEKSAGFPVK
jgi:hypothetical protein